MKWILKIFIKKWWHFHNVSLKELVKITMKKFFFLFYWGLFLKNQNWACLWVISLIRLLIQRYAQFQLFRKGPGNSFSTIFWVWFFKKNVSHVIFYSLAIFHCPFAFTSWFIGRYVYCNCFFPRLWPHKFCN